MLKRVLIVVLLVLVSLLFISNVNAAVGDICSSGSACGNGEVCGFSTNRCILAQCTRNSECSDNGVCIRRQCASRDSYISCGSSRDCGIDNLCYTSLSWVDVCINPNQDRGRCTNDAGCSNGYFCRLVGNSGARYCVRSDFVGLSSNGGTTTQTPSTSSATAPPPPVMCARVEDCPHGGYTCAAGICEISSAARALINQGRTASPLNCDGSRLPKIGQRCLRDDTCACGEQCTDRICEETGTSTSGFVCTSDRNCNAGESCVNSACVTGYVGQCPLSALRNSCGCQNSNSCNGLYLGLCSSASARAITCAAGHQCSVVNGRASCVLRPPQETGTPPGGPTQQPQSPATST